MHPAALEWQTERPASGRAAVLLFLSEARALPSECRTKGELSASLNGPLYKGGGGARNGCVLPAWLHQGKMSGFRHWLLLGRG